MEKIIKQAFTLIELLVVIAIIGILSGLIIVSMGGITSSATVAKAQVFSNSLRNALMMNLVAEYKLDGNANDNWGGRNGTLHGTTTVSSGCPQGTCLSFNGSSDYVNFSDNDAVFNFGSKMTAMIWVKGLPSTAGRQFFSQSDGSASESWWIGSYNVSPYDKLEVFLSDFAPFSSAHTKYWYTNNPVLDGKWHLVGFTFNAGVLNVYIDGQIAAVSTVWNPNITTLYNSASDINIGCDVFNGSPINCFTGSMDEARLYNEAIPTSQIKEQYFAGLNKLLANGSISEQEYIERINNETAKN